MVVDSAMFTPARIGLHKLEHKVVLAPLTRMRGTDYIPDGSLMAEYYAQRSTSGGLVITEGTMISPQAGGQHIVPGIWNSEQGRYWKVVTEAIRAKGAISCMQMWHRGRCPGKRQWEYEGIKYTPIGPSAIPEAEKKPVPREMSIADIDNVIAEYVNAVKVAIDQAGFQLIEIHMANGYLLDQFLQSMSNKRTDEYGGSMEKRMTLMMKVLEAVTKAVGQEKIGIRLSPFSEFQGMREKEPMKLFVPVVEKVLERFPRLAFIHLVESRMNGGADRHNFSDDESLDPIRKVIAKHNESSKTGHVQIIVAGGLTAERALEHSKRYPDELLAFGRYFISNPDLLLRLRNGWPLTKYDRTTFYTPGEKGYTDYPIHEQARANL